MLSCGLRVSVQVMQKLTPTLRQAIGETSGEIPVYSLHRIKGMMKRQPIQISDELRMLLLQNLLLANEEYKTASGNDWNCLTSNNLVDAIEATDGNLRRSIEATRLPTQYARIAERLFAKLHEGRTSNVTTIQQWFESNFDSLLYDMRSNIPWAVVCRLRRNLGYWIATKANPFGQDIEEMILEVGKENGVDTDDPEEAWEKMGGKVFKKKETEE